MPRYTDRNGDAFEADEALIALCKRAVACKHFRWMPGMLLVSPEGAPQLIRLRFSMAKAWNEEPSERVVFPALSDPATFGCLLALVREAWKSPLVHPSQATIPDGEHWYLCRSDSPDSAVSLTLRVSGSFGFNYEPEVSAETEIELLVKALEMAP